MRYNEPLVGEVVAHETGLVSCKRDSKIASISSWRWVAAKWYCTHSNRAFKNDDMLGQQLKADVGIGKGHCNDTSSIVAYIAAKEGRNRSRCCSTRMRIR